MAWHRIEQGTGRPLVLLHGIGSSCQAWAPVMGLLAAERRVIAFDLPGHGRSPVPPPGEPLGVRSFAGELAGELRALGVEGPVDLVGNSLGGWTALEAAKLGLARSVVGLSPAGLWRRPDRSAVGKFRLMRSLIRRYPRQVEGLLQQTAGRTAMTFLIYGRPWLVPGPVAAEAIRTFDRTEVLDQLFESSRADRFTGGHDIGVPVTIAFGRRDRLLRRRTSQFADQLPVSTRWVPLPGCGHVPMGDDPALVARTVLEGTA